MQSRALVKQHRAKLWIAGILVFICAVVFGSLLRAEFVNYDDPDFVTANPHVLQGLRWSEIKWAFTALYIYWQPMTWMSYMVDSALYGGNAGGFHATNLVLHIGTSVLL